MKKNRSNLNGFFYWISKGKRVDYSGRFLKMIDDLQTPNTKPIINTEVFLPLYFS